MNALDTVGVLFARTWVKTVRRPVVLTFSFVQPLMWMLFFGFLFERYELLALDSEFTYVDFLAPGVCAMTVLFGASQSGIGWIRDLQTGFLQRMLNTPRSHHSILAGKVLADVSRLCLQAVIVLCLALILGATIDTSGLSVVAALGVLALFAAGFSCLSCAIAFKTRAQEAMAVFVHVVNMPLLFTSTALVPDKQMPGWLASASSWNPLTTAVDAWRAALLFDELPGLRAYALMLVLVAFTYSLAAGLMRGCADEE